MNENERDRIAAAINALRPDWPTASIRTLIADKLNNRTRRDVAVALAWVACESATKTPARVLEAGPWWHASNAESSGETVTHTGKTVGLRHGDPRQICGICDMWRADCEQRRATSGHDFVPRVACSPADAEAAAKVAELRALRNPPSPDDTDEKETA